MVSVGRMGFYAFGIIMPVLISALVAAFTPRSAMRAVISAAVCIIVLWYGIIRPLMIFYSMSVLYNPQSASVSQVINGNATNVSAPSMQAFITTVKNNKALRESALITWIMSFINSLVKAGISAAAMFAVYAVKSLFAKDEN